ncbi:MAG: hypothetical protein KJ070_13000 [Verrucomicrobia bacterium]|nr:hypothetical protein [Verrucomicrobiota bacterium]
MHNNESPFGEVIYAYTRAQAVADGFQVEVTKVAAEAGIRFPVFLTRTVYDAYVTVPPGQDEAGRLWDIVWMLRFAIRRSRPGCDRLPVALYVRNDNRGAKLIKLVAACGPAGRGRPATGHHCDDARRGLIPKPCSNELENLQ